MPTTPAPTSNERLVDVAVALLALALSLVVLAVGGDFDGGDDARDLDPLGGVLAAAASLPLVARRRSPFLVFVLTAAASIAIVGVGYAPGPPIGATVALFFLASSQRAIRPRAWLMAATVGAFFVGHVAAVGLAQDGFVIVPLLFGALVWGGAWVLGDRVRQRRARMSELEERALRAEREAERERRLARAEERTRLARDLHDSAGHAINVILVQAGAARLRQERDPAGTRAALKTIEAVARETIVEIDQLVHVLRENGTAEAGVEAPPGLAALDTLAERQRAAGLETTVVVRGERRALPAGVDRAAYRILQEALTNAAKHGRGTADVELLFGPNMLELGVTNPAEPGGSDAGGHGLAGMRERATLLGGSFDAGAHDGRFRVRARLPYDAGERR